MSEAVQIYCTHCGQALAMSAEQRAHYKGPPFLCMHCGEPFNVTGAVIPTTLSYAGLASPSATGRLPQANSGRIGVTAAALLLLGLICGWAVLLPPLSGRTQSNADLVQCASNLRQIGVALRQYANVEPAGAFPDTLAHLLARTPVKTEFFVCPASSDTPSKAKKAAQVATDLAAGGHDSFVYVGAGLTNHDPPKALMMYEQPSHHRNGTVSVLYADGMVELLSASELQALIASGAQSKPDTTPVGGLAPERVGTNSRPSPQ